MKRFLHKNNGLNLKTWGLFFFIGFCLALIFKDFITPVIFNGKSFIGRSLSVKILLLFGSTIAITIFIFLITNIYSLFFKTSLKRYVERILLIIKNFFITNNEKRKQSNGINKFLSLIAHTKISWQSLGIILLISVFLNILSEWVFIISKPSFLTLVPFTEKLAILGFTISILFSLSMILFIFAFIILRKKRTNTAPIFLLIFPAIILTITLLLMVDNFTYTVFRVGIITANNFFRVLYIVMFFATTLYIWKDYIKLSVYLDKNIYQSSQKSLNRLNIISYSVLIFFILSPFLFHNRLSFSLAATSSSIENKRLENKPHIVLITVEALNSDHMSLFGYERDTTPFLRTFSHDALIAENSFTNSSNTAGSITSILTSKYPTTTRVLYPPDILRSDDAYQHLPGLLKSEGYKTIQYSIDHFADAYQLNMLNGFDVANGRSHQRSPIFSLVNRYLDENSAYFFYELNTRLTNRLAHIFFIQSMDNTFEQITESKESYNDIDKLKNVILNINDATDPIFFHIHLMNTHGPKFYPVNQVFSSGQDITNQDNWSIDFYDDSMLEFDHNISYFWDQLNQIGMENNTVIVIASDHGKQWTTTDKLPLLIRFPDGANSGTISTNVQNLDIAPSILDYLGFDIPGWMEGNSLIREKEINYPIFSVGTSKSIAVAGVGWQLNEAYLTPPFYQFSFMVIIDCHKWHRLDLDDLTWSSGVIKNYENHCSENQLLSFDQISGLVIDRLSLDSFELDEDTRALIQTPNH